MIMTLLRHLRRCLALAVLGVPMAFAQNNVLQINKTETNNGSLTGTITQKGRCLLVPLSNYMDANADFTIGFWIKRNLALDANSSRSKDSARDSLLGLQTQSDDPVGLNVGMSAIPNDSVWHLVSAEFTGTGERAYTVVVYVDGTLELSTTHDFYDGTGSNWSAPVTLLRIGAQVFPDSFSPFSVKNATETSFFLDDVVVWRGVTEGIRKIMTNVANYGPSQLPEGDSRLTTELDFEGSTTQTAPVVEDNSHHVSSSFAPPADFDLATAVAADIFAEDSDDRRKYVAIDVASDFGGEDVSPNAGTTLVPYDSTGNTTIDFSAPRYVYLDRYRNELGTDASEIDNFETRAFYRARCVGYTVKRGKNSDATSTAELSFSQATTADISVIWNWEIDYGGTIDLGTGDIVGLSDSDVTDDTAGLDWYGVDESVPNLPTRFSSEVNASVAGAGLPVRFAAQSYILENAPDSPERSVVISPGADYLYTSDIGVDLGSGDGSFTIEFWARRDTAYEGTFDDTVICIGSNFSARQQIRVGFTPNSTSSGDPNRFFVTDNVGTRHEAPTAFIDDQWHHWAAVNDGAADLITLYRDGEVVGEIASEFTFTGNSAMAIGVALSAGFGTTTHPYSGGLNNVRIWSTVRTADELQESMTTTEYGAVDGLEVEVTFDRSDLEVSGNGLHQSLFTGAASTRIESVDEISTTWDLESSSTASNFVLDAAVVPDDYFGLLFSGEILIEKTGFYTFYLRSDDGSRLTIDGDIVVDNDGLHSAANELSATVQLAAGLHDIAIDYFQDGGSKSLEVNYASQSLGIAKQAIPDALLYKDGPVATLTTRSSEGRDLEFEFRNFEAPFTDASDTDRIEAALFPGFLYVSEIDGADQVHIATGSGASSYDVTDWTAAHWVWDKEFLLTIQASASTAKILRAAASLPFLSGEISSEVGLDSLTADGELTVTVEESWVREGAVVTVGTRYRTDDNCYQLTGIAGQLNAFSAITMDTVVDGVSPDGRVSREYTFSSGMTAPGSLVFQFGPTVHQAEVAIGEGFTVSSTEVADAQLVPDLCGSNPVLAIEQTGPTVTSSPRASTNGVPTGGSGDPYVWDYLGKTFYPLRPGEYTLSWPDANDPNTDYSIMITAEFPTETVTREDRENEDGSRQGDAPDYEVDVTFASVADTFPASPRGHYRYVVSDGADTVPVALDPSANDRWYFQRMAFSESDGAVVQQGSNLFGSSDDGKRSVLLYSYRADPDKVATGDASKELFAVRVVDAEAAEDVTANDDVSAVTALRELRLSEGIGLYGRSTGGGANFAIGSDQPRTWQFAARLDEVSDGTDASRILLEVSTNGDVYQFGLRPATASENPGGFYFARKSATTPFTEAQAIELDEVAVDYGWHVWTIVADAGTISIYRDGVLVAAEAFEIPYTITGGQHRYGYSAAEAGGWMEGSIDNIRIWTAALTAEEIRQAVLTREPVLASAGEPVYAVTCDGDISGSTIDKSQGTATGGLQVVEAGGATATALDILVDQTADTFQEVATRLLSRLDTAGLESGFVLNATSNYNASIYNRTADPGEWGPLYPVNWSGLYQADGTELHVAYYENPSKALPRSTTVLHPAVSWPYVVVDYDEVEYPSKGVNKDNLIVIASRLGSEGVDANGSDTQLVFDPADYANLAIYNQPDRDAPGFNPNEEHALVATSIKALLTGDSAFSLQQNAAFALQYDLNRWGENDSHETSDGNQADDFTSEPWVLVQYENLATGEAEMRAYCVAKELLGDAETDIQNFPIDILDPATHEPDPALYAAISNVSYRFEYPIFAGDLLIPPYPLGGVVGNLTMELNTGGNLQSDGVNRRTLWNDKNRNPWCVSGDGRFFYENWYPLRDDFWFDLNLDGNPDALPGTPIAWLPEAPADGAGKAYLDAGDFTASSAGQPSPVNAFYTSFWGDGYPVLKRGETVTYAGGEYKAENPLAEGLPAIVGWAAGEVVFDSRTPSMVLSVQGSAGAEDPDGYTARMIRPLDRYEVEFDQSIFNEIENEDGTLTPASPARVMVDGSRWYFRELTGSLQKRFYYDSLFGKLVFRGRLNELEGGDPDLTDTPVSLSILEPNFLSAEDFADLLALGETSDYWKAAVTEIYTQAQNPEDLAGVTIAKTVAEDPGFWSGLETVPASTDDDAVPQFDFYSEGANGLTFVSAAEAGEVRNLSSLGTGATLVPNPTLLTEDADEELYVTVVENNHPDVSGAVTVHVIALGAERFRGAIKVVEAQDVFDEKINLRHTGDFGGNTGEVYYEWWVRDTGALSSIGRPDTTGDGSWQRYAAGPGLNAIAFEGRPDISLADKFFYVRYGGAGEFADLGAVGESDWRLVDLDDPNDTWTRTDGGPVPYQWAGASNSPQLQADGGRDFIPQLMMGWVKRVLDRINPYEARFTDFANNESPSIFSSMIQLAGKPYAGDVALNSDKDVIEGVGLIELYETVLNRALSLTLDIGNPSEGTNQALLLAATRLAILYEQLAREAYVDAQNPTVVVDADGQLSGSAPHIFAFQNQVSSLAREELALLRGTDFVKAYPAYNRLFWNYVKGLGEAAYNANYAMWDVNIDGFINEYDAAELYPQGHGDAWGHFLSASEMHYALLRAPGFDWKARSEFYSLLDNVLPADFLDEKSFARIAAAKARTGNEVVRATYAQAYTADPEAQWQGYADTADPARAWGVSEWSHRAGQGAYFDWVVGNALVPGSAADSSDAGELDLSTESGLDQIDRSANRRELSEIAAAYAGIQTTLDHANTGMTPLGLDPDALTFDIDPFRSGLLWERSTHFEQTFERAVEAGRNALNALDYAAGFRQQLNRLTTDTSELKREAVKQDISFRNRLIEIFGTPYEGTIGPGQIYPEGYTGPDTLLYLYIDETTLAGVTPTSPNGKDPDGTADDDVPTSRYVSIRQGLADFRRSLNGLDFNSDIRGVAGSFDAPDFKDVFSDLYLTENGAGETDLDGEDLAISVPVVETGDYALQAPDGWGRRGSYGRIQKILNEMLAAQIELEIATDAYGEYLAGLEILNERISLQIDLLKGKQEVRSEFKGGVITLQVLNQINAIVKSTLDYVREETKHGRDLAEAFPRVTGLAADITSIPRFSAIFSAALLDLSVASTGTLPAEIFEAENEITIKIEELRYELDQQRFEEYQEILNLATEFAQELKEEQNQRNAIALRVQRLHNLSLGFQSTVAEGLRLLDERDALNKFLASTAQSNRYRDMALRLARNDALEKYRDAFLNAKRYAWLAAKAYDYETGLAVNDPASATAALEQIVKTQGLGLWNDGAPAIGKGGLAEPLAQLRANFQTLRGQLGLNNPDYEGGSLSLRFEHFRISQADSSDDRWNGALQAARVDDLWSVPEFVQFCRPFADPEDGPQPGLVIDFSTQITPGLNVFGRQLGGGDSAYSVSNFATKIAKHAIWFEGYDQTGMSTTPRAYLVPVGADVMRLSGDNGIKTRTWNIVEQRVPVPFTINETNLSDIDFIPSLDSVNGSFAELRRTGDSQALVGAPGFASEFAEIFTDLGDSRHVGRSIWNTRWLLVIPGLALHADPDTGLDRFVESVRDIRLQFETYSHEGQ